MRTKLKLAFYRAIFSVFSVALVCAYIALIVAKVMKIWGLEDTVSEDNLMYYLIVGMMALFAIAQSIFVISSFWNGTMLMDSLCFNAKSKRMNKWTLIIDPIILGVGLFAFLMTLLWKIFVVETTLTWELTWAICSLTSMIWIDATFVLSYQFIFRRDYLVGNLKSNISRHS